MRFKSRFALAKWAAALAVVTVPLIAQEMALDSKSSIRIALPQDSPVTLLSAETGESRAAVRGGAMMLDVRMALSLRNSSSRRVRGVTLLLTALEQSPFGKASVAKCIDVGPGESFPVWVDVRLVRPVQSSGGAGSPLVQVTLDGVLFDNLDFYGPNKLNSRRTMTVWENEAQRDRKYYKQVLQTHGPQGLQQEVLESLARQADRPRVDVAMGHVSGAAVLNPGKAAQFAALDLPDSPLKLVDGWAEVAGNEARSPRLEVANRSSRAVRHVEVGWLVKDGAGKQVFAGSVPSSEGQFLLSPGKSAKLEQDASIKLTRSALPVNILGMSAFVSQVEFADGQVWVPLRESLDKSQLLRVLAPSPEEQRLGEIYRKKGLAALIEELKRF